MKKLLITVISSAFFLFSLNLFSQIDVTITDLKTKKNIQLSDVFDEYNLNKSKPTVLITWSGKWCAPCIRLIRRYNKCDPSMINLITVNVDSESSREEVLDKGYHKEWNNALNFNGNVEKNNGFGRVFKVSSAPLVLIFEDGKMKDALASYSIYPYKLVQENRIKGIKFLWNSSEDLNSIAWNYYQKSDDKEKLEEAKKWVIRSIKLDENYNNVDTYAALLFKTGHYKNALKKAKKAIEIAKKNNDSYESTIELINKIIEKM